MLSTNWNIGRASIEVGRIFEFTDSHIIDKFIDLNEQPLLDELALLPCLFMNQGSDDEIAYIGHIYTPQIAKDRVTFRFSLYDDLPTLKNSVIYANRMKLHMPEDFDFYSSYWAVKDVDLLLFLLRNIQLHRQRPTVFEIPKHENIDPKLVSVMMPFRAEFDSVYESIKNASKNIKLKCERVDHIWENDTIIQDVVLLIDTARIVVCDCTGGNANVLYEVGIAHTLGRNVILITQNTDDIPFDLKSIRHIKYENNSEGIKILTKRLQRRMVKYLTAE